ncbi:MAG: hypothetical protein IPK93_08375 [Solirubrobacterales bacterium]|nr:hypothetical protein [Solirubrobacterales bacterium]
MSEASPQKPGHPKLVALLVVIGTLIAVIGIFSIWANRQALNTDNWVSTSDKILQDPDVQQQLSDYIAAEIFANVNVQEDIAGELPPRLAPLAAPIAGGLEQLAPQATERALESSQFETVWRDANRAAHLALLKVLDGGSADLSTTNGAVVLNLNSLLTQVTSQIGVGSKLTAKIPPDAGQITVLKADELSAAQDGAQVVRGLPIVLTLLVALLYGLAIFLAGPRRREALRSVGIGFVVAGVVALVARGIGGHSLVDALATKQAAEPAAQAVWNIGTSLLVTIATSAITFGILLFLGAWLAGPTRLATRARGGRLRPTSVTVRCWLVALRSQRFWS